MKGIIKSSTNVSRAKGVDDGSEVIIHQVIGQSFIVSKTATSEQFKIAKRSVTPNPGAGCPVPVEYLATKPAKESVIYKIGDVVKIVNNCPIPARGQTKELLGHVGVVASRISGNGSHQVQIYTPDGDHYTNASGEFPSFKACNLQLTNEELTRSSKNFTDDVFVPHIPPPVSAKKAAAMTQIAQCNVPYDEFEAIADDCIEAMIDYGLNASNVDSVRRPTVQSRLRKRFSSKKVSTPCPVPITRRTSAEKIAIARPVSPASTVRSASPTRPASPGFVPIVPAARVVTEEEEVDDTPGSA